MLEDLQEAFGVEHQRTYGHRAGFDEPVELVNLRVVGVGVSKRDRVSRVLNFDTEKHAVDACRWAYFGPDVGWVDTPVIGRSQIGEGVDGPCIIEEYDSTCLIPPYANGLLDDNGNIVINLTGQQ